MVVFNPSLGLRKLKKNWTITFKYLSEAIKESNGRSKTTVKCIFLGIIFQVTDQNKRQVLGDLIYLIRFPNMDADEFIRSVSSAEVLTTEESLNLILLKKGSTPKKELSFSSVERCGAWTEEFFKGLSIEQQYDFEYGFQYGYRHGNQPQAFHSNTGSTLLITSVPFQINYGKNKDIYVKSVFLINDTNYEFSNVRLLDSEGKISRLENRTYVGCQLYEAVFNPKVIMQSNTTASIIVQQSLSGQKQPSRQSTPLQGLNTITANPNTNTTFTMQSVPWNFVVGFKYRTM